MYDVVSLIALTQTKMQTHAKAIETIDTAMQGVKKDDIPPSFFYVKGIALGVKGLGKLQESAAAFA